MANFVNSILLRLFLYIESNHYILLILLLSKIVLISGGSLGVKDCACSLIYCVNALICFANNSCFSFCSNKHAPSSRFDSFCIIIKKPLLNIISKDYYAVFVQLLHNTEVL